MTGVKVARKLKDGDNRPLWVPSMINDVPSTINGHSYPVIAELADVTSGEQPAVFGDLEVKLCQ